jgi:hypothetical protein
MKVHDSHVSTLSCKINVKMKDIHVRSRSYNMMVIQFYRFSQPPIPHKLSRTQIMCQLSSNGASVSPTKRSHLQYCSKIIELEI